MQFIYGDYYMVIHRGKCDEIYDFEIHKLRKMYYYLQYKCIEFF